MSFTLDMGMTSYETLSGSESDRYQFILPYYNFYKKLPKIKIRDIKFFIKR